MSNLEPDPPEAVGGGRAAVAEAPVRQLLPGREVLLGPRGLRVTRTLPHRQRRMVGAWCFVDQYGLEDVTGTAGMRVPPHPHTGLQTVSWLLAGEVLHRDSLGNRALIRPGELGLMTAGRGIAHAEVSPPGPSAVPHGVQLWVALPAASRHTDPGFAHHPVVPAPLGTGVAAAVILGELAGIAGPVPAHSPLTGAELTLDRPLRTDVPLRPDFEYAALGLTGSVRVAGAALAPGTLLYLGCGRAAVTVDSARPSRLLLLGGEPFDEQIVMWWNFVGRSHDEIVRYREEWMAGRRFGAVAGDAGDPLPAPPMPTTPLKPRPPGPRPTG